MLQIWRWRVSLIIFCILSIFLSGCVNTKHHRHVPVVVISNIESIPANGKHRVAVGETLYSIAWRYGLDYQQLGRINHLSAPWHVKSGQWIFLRAHRPVIKINIKEKNKIKTLQHKIYHVVPKTKIKTKIKTATIEDQFSASCKMLGRVKIWRWPANGSVSGIYSSFNKGINIAGKLGDPIFATAAGQVVYQGSGLRGYGNLIIIKHSGTWLSAYAWNKDVLVRRGDCVYRGQRIATMGQGLGQLAMLHFEIRRSGLPVNPLYYLANRS